jgi:lipid II:glycine glycyltransferase (peptidoglycan interpeptide bridge formation enzyme)
MRLRPATDEEIGNWDAAVLTNPDRGDLLQSSFFAEQKQRDGWSPRQMVYDGPRPVHTLFLVKDVPLLGQIWYAPKGPGLADPADLGEVVAAGADYAGQHPGILLFKIEPELPADTTLPPALLRTTPVQPNVHTIVIDLRPGEDEIFAGFRQRGRRYVRKAQKQGVTVERRPPTRETMELMYALFRETADRGDFHVRDYSYYERFWSAAARAGLGSFHFATLDDAPVAAAFVTHFGTKGLYKDGASSRAIGNSGASYLLQWEIMRDLRARGVTSYDLHTTPPPDALEDQDHPHYGLGQFKSGFSKHIISYVGTLDQPVRQRAYRVWQRIGQRLALQWSSRVRRRLYY